MVASEPSDSGVARVGVTRGGNRRGPRSPKEIFLTFLEWKFLQYLVFYTKKLKSSQQISYMTLFSLLHKRHVIYHTKFSTYLFFNHLTHKINFFTILLTKFIFFPLGVSPWDGHPGRPAPSARRVTSCPGTVPEWDKMSRVPARFIQGSTMKRPGISRLCYFVPSMNRK